MKDILYINLANNYPRSEDGQVLLDEKQSVEVALNQFEKAIHNIDLTEDRLFIESLGHYSMLCVNSWIKTATCMKKANVPIDTIKNIILEYAIAEEQIIEEAMGQIIE